MIFQDTVIDIGRPVRASAKVLDVNKLLLVVNLLGFDMWIFGCLADLSVIIIAGNKPFYRVKHLKSEENIIINVGDLNDTHHVQVSDIAPHLCHVCVVHVSGVDKIMYRGITQPISHFVQSF